VEAACQEPPATGQQGRKKREQRDKTLVDASVGDASRYEFSVTEYAQRQTIQCRFPSLHLACCVCLPGLAMGSRSDCPRGAPMPREISTHRNFAES
jgi:hypothetical protein